MNFSASALEVAGVGRAGGEHESSDSGRGGGQVDACGFILRSGASTRAEANRLTRLRTRAASRRATVLRTPSTVTISSATHTRPKPSEPRPRQLLVVHEPPEQEVDRRHEVLQRAEHGERHAGRRRRRTGSSGTAVVTPASATSVRSAAAAAARDAVAEPAEGGDDDRRRHDEHERLGGEALDRRQRDVALAAGRRSSTSPR